MKRIKLPFFLVWMIFVTTLTGQSIVSPYSNNAIGEINSMALPNNVGMGDLGIGSVNARHINITNPAFLVYNSYSSFQIGFMADFRDINTNSGKISDATAAMRHLVMAFPILNNRWTTSVGILPYSSVNFQLFNETPVTGNITSINQATGEGGLTQFFWSNGVRLYDNLSIGLRVGYVFGSIRHMTRNNLVDDNIVISDYVIELTEETNYKDFIFSGSIANRFVLSETQLFNVGLIFGLPGRSSGTKDIFYKRLSIFSGGVLQLDPIEEDIPVDDKLPSEMGIGVSYEKLDKMTVGMDFSMLRWKPSSETSSELNNAIKVVLGGELIPDATNIRNYLKRVNYRMGLSYQQLPYLINKREINEFGINFGASFPVNQLSTFDIAFKYGVRGTTNNDLIKENYFQVVLGATINDIWFVKRRYD